MNREKFKNPDDKFSPYCFLFANDNFEKEHVTDIAVEMQKKGISAGYIQDRGIKKHKFLSDGFFDTYKSVIENTTLPLGFCDEVGGMYGSSALSDDMPRGQSLYWRSIDGVVPECFCAVCYREENYKIKTESLTLLKPGDTISEGQKAYAFYKYHAKSRSGSEIDYLNPKSADIILDNIYEKFKENLGEYFGNRITTSFMDLEGDYGYKLAYSEELEKKYFELYGESMLVNLPLLFAEDTESKWLIARYRYYSAVAETYSVFFEKIAAWCKKNNIEFTGHTWEENLYGQVLQEGDFYKIQKNFSIIGVDSLRLDCLEPRDFKEAQTIADRENKLLMCELMGCAGFGLSPAEMKRAINSVTVWGVNHVVLHGIYSDRDINRMVFAPDFYDVNSYWNYFGQISDYIKRTSYVNTLGCMSVDTVLFNPIDSVKALVGDYVFDKDNEFGGYIIEQRDMLNCKYGLEVRDIENSYTKAISELTNKRIQFYIYDERYFETENFDKIENIVIPSTVIISEKLLKKLAILSKEGKKIYFIGDTPYATIENGADYKKTNALIADIKNIKTTLDIEQKIVIKNGEFNLKASHRKENYTNYFWLYNDTDKKHDAVIELKGIKGRVSLMNCETGEISKVYSVKSCQGTEVYLHFDEFEGYWIVVEEPEIIELTDFEINGANICGA